MTDRLSQFRFIDLATAAEALGATRVQVLDWVTAGRLKPFQGAGQSAVFRTRAVRRWPPRSPRSARPPMPRPPPRP